VSAPDPVLHELREQISATDRAIVDAFNTRLELVARIKAHKESRGIGFLDPEREQSMLRDLPGRTAARCRPRACTSCSPRSSTSPSGRCRRKAASAPPGQSPDRYARVAG
jgi:hypothetical protein